MRFLYYAMIILCVLFFFIFGIMWIGCSPGELAGDVRTLLTEARRRQELDRQKREVFQRIEDRVQVMEAVAAGKLTLFEAAKRFERIGLSPNNILDDRVRERPRDEAGWCRMVLRFVHAHLSRTPCRRSQVMPPLVQAYRQRFGELPADLLRALQPYTKPASAGE